jgi:alpha-beta hydrolase superfamily lysophospholipase
MVIIGTSMGGIIASLLAARNPRIDALVMANPPFRYRNPLLRLALRLPLRLKGFRLAPPPGHEDEYFPYFPFRCLKILRDMAEAALESAPEVRQPLLVFSSKRDRSVDPGGTRRFLDAAGSKEKNIRILPSAPHSPFAPYHKNNALVFEEILSFLTRL